MLAYYKILQETGDAILQEIGDKILLENYSYEIVCKSINGLAYDSIKSKNGLATENIKSINGLE